MNQDTSGIAPYLSAESTTVEFKRELNFSKAKQWLKTVSAFANTKGGTILVGVTDTKEPVGVPDIKQVVEKTAETINAHIDPVPRYELTTIHENGKDFLVIYISEGLNTPYYYLSGETAQPMSDAATSQFPPRPMKSETSFSKDRISPMMLSRIS